MKNKKVFYSVGFGISMFLMFFWIFLMVFLTGQREIHEFSEIDKYIFIGFIVVEIITIIVFFIITYLLTKALIADRKPLPQTPQNPTKTHAKAVAQGTALMIGCFVAGLLAMTAGIWVRKGIVDGETGVFAVAFLACLLIDVLCIILNHILPKTVMKKLEKANIEEGQKFLLSHREFAKETTEKKLTLLKKIIFITDVYSAVLSIIGIIAAFCTGVITEGDNKFFVLLSSAMILMGASRIRFPVSKEVFSDDKSYVEQKDFPSLYALAEKAEKESLVSRAK